MKLGNGGQSGGTSAYGDYLHSLTFEQSADAFDDGLLVLDHQQGMKGPAPDRLECLARVIARRVAAGKEEMECGPATDFALGEDVPAVLCQDLMGDRESEPRSTTSLRREERLEDLVD